MGVPPDKSFAELSREFFNVDVSFATRVAGRVPVKPDQSFSKLFSTRLRSVGKFNFFLVAQYIQLILFSKLPMLPVGVDRY